MDVSCSDLTRFHLVNAQGSEFIATCLLDLNNITFPPFSSIVYCRHESSLMSIQSLMVRKGTGVATISTFAEAMDISCQGTTAL